jgi:hypothetical protein
MIVTDKMAIFDLDHHHRLVGRNLYQNHGTILCDKMRQWWKDTQQGPEG